MSRDVCSIKTGILRMTKKSEDFITFEADHLGIDLLEAYGRFSLGVFKVEIAF